MSAPQKPELPQIPGLFSTVKKFRELSANKIMYVFDDHTPANPHTLTVTSVLPAPRKGNPGTMKTTMAFHKSVTLDAGTAAERAVPVVARLETSFPMGTSKADRKAVLNALAAGTSLDDVTISSLLEKGILPQD
uniref:Uncharacterized protein n=1 Tax=Beihai levi-like virus 29 TaxID=1922415 RepID=A0A1L3KIA8_9VIRU|nr:hypothetical protein [Beihai levi-like virus 29]